MKSPDDVWVTPDPTGQLEELNNIKVRLQSMAEYLQRIGDMLAPYADQGHSETLEALLKRLLKELDRYREADRQIDLNEYEIWD